MQTMTIQQCLDIAAYHKAQGNELLEAKWIMAAQEKTRELSMHKSKPPDENLWLALALLFVAGAVALAFGWLQFQILGGIR